MIATGIYAPTVKIFETSNLGIKCERGMESEVLDFQILGDDYEKLAFLHADRSVELHAKYGKHFKI